MRLYNTTTWYYIYMISNIFWGAFIAGIIQSSLLIAAFMTLFFVLALLKKRNDIADIIWGLGFVAVAWFNFYTFGFREIFFGHIEGGIRIQTALVVLAVTVWGFRLFTHIFLRNKDKDEDFRYKKWREEWGKWFVARSFLQIFMLQGFLMLLISLPVISATIFDAKFISWITIIGFLIWLTGFLFESVGDYQLSKFIKDPLNKGKIMTRGLWNYTRHPNYFGEVTGWWGIYIMALPATKFILIATWPIWVISLIGPLTITFLILKVSGIPMLEKKYEGNAEFDEYKKNTNAFFPWFKFSFKSLT